MPDEGSDAEEGEDETAALGLQVGLEVDAAAVFRAVLKSEKRKAACWDGLAKKVLTRKLRQQGLRGIRTHGTANFHLLGA